MNGGGRTTAPAYRAGGAPLGASEGARARRRIQLFARFARI